LHLNPIRFTHETDVLAELPELLKPWKSLTHSGLNIAIRSNNRVLRKGHWIRQVVVSLTNDGNQRITKLNCWIRLPASLLKHWPATYPHEVKADDGRNRDFRFDERSAPNQIAPHSTESLMTFDICTHCAADSTGEISSI